MVVVRAPAPDGLAPDLPREERDVEAEAFQRPAEEAVELVAVASPVPADDLLPGVIDVERDGDPPVDVEILERHRGETPALQPSQEWNRRTLAPDRQVLEERPELGLTERRRNGRPRSGVPEGCVEEGRVQHGRRSR
jgi:hypothetical protein